MSLETLELGVSSLENHLLQDLLAYLRQIAYLLSASVPYL